MQQRAEVVPYATGRVLELGFGSGLNLPYYDPDEVEHVWALDPSPEMWALARERVDAAPFPVDYLQAPAEAIPLNDDSADTVLVTFSLCTIPDVARAMNEVRRVLKQGGRLLFCEHGAAPDEHVLRWQGRLNPLWSTLAGGCQLNRPIPDLLRQSHFEMTDLSADYIPGWKIDSFIYRGAAVPA